MRNIPSSPHTSNSLSDVVHHVNHTANAHDGQAKYVTFFGIPAAIHTTAPEEDDTTADAVAPGIVRSFWC